MGPSVPATPVAAGGGPAATTSRTVPLCTLVPVDREPQCRLDNACPAPDEVQMITFTTLPDGTISQSNGGCQRSGPDQAAVAAAALRALDTVVPVPPTLRVAPPGGAVTQLPLIVSASDDQPRDVDLTVLGVPLRVHLVPSWDWSFGDGSRTTTTTAGRGYDGTDPDSAPPGYYVQHTYRHRGQVRLAVRVRWSATVTRGDTGATTTLTGQVIRETARQLPVREARAQLTG